MNDLKLGDLVYDLNYIGMIIGVNAGELLPLYRVEWYASHLPAHVYMEELDAQRASYFRKIFLKYGGR